MTRVDTTTALFEINAERRAASGAVRLIGATGNAALSAAIKRLIAASNAEQPLAEAHTAAETALLALEQSNATDEELAAAREAEQEANIRWQAARDLMEVAVGAVHQVSGLGAGDTLLQLRAYAWAYDRDDCLKLPDAVDLEACLEVAKRALTEQEASLSLKGPNVGEAFAAKLAIFRQAEADLVEINDAHEPVQAASFDARTSFTKPPLPDELRIRIPGCRIIREDGSEAVVEPSWYEVSTRERIIELRKGDEAAAGPMLAVLERWEAECNAAAEACGLSTILRTEKELEEKWNAAFERMIDAGCDLLRIPTASPAHGAIKREIFNEHFDCEEDMVRAAEALLDAAAGCEFHAIAGTNSTARWARIPREGGHGFHGIMGAL